VKLKSAAAVLVSVIGFVTVASADDWPSKPVRMVSPFAAGGSSDTVARIVANQLDAQIGRPFVVENRPGAGGLIGSGYVAKSPPDGYTFVVSSITTHVLGPLTVANPEYDPARDFSHVAMFGGPPTVIVAHPSLGAKTLQELIAGRKGKSEPLAYSSAGPRTIGNLIMEYLAEREHIKLSHVAYKGAGQAIADLIAGHVKLASFTLTAARTQITAGQVVALAMSSAQRMPQFPNVPTLAELGYPDLVATAWLGLAGPAGVPTPIVDRLNKEVGHALEVPRVRERLIGEAFEIRAMQPKEIADFVQAETTKWTPLAKRLMSSAQ
jgi:tripartite-type tricarboxylate transporter receptor subunit TctC